MIRNILCYKNKLGLKEKIIITILAIILTFKFNNLGYIGLLPLISTVSYIWLMNIKDVRKFKLLIIFTMLMWLIYDVVIKSYTSAIFDFMNIIANMFTLLQIKLVKNQIRFQILSAIKAECNQVQKSVNLKGKMQQSEAK